MQTAERLEIPFIHHVNQKTHLEDISSLLDKLQRHSIINAPWPEYKYKPEALFSIAHAANCILLKFYITEDAVVAKYTEPNDPVYRDSCVEFFIAFNNDDEYYNLEFNCIGTCLMSYGPRKENREFASRTAIRKIKHQSLMYGAIPYGKIGWELTLMIPDEVFYHHDLSLFKPQKCRANFYKCGDDLPNPHYLAWSNIESAKPNFHLSDYFGKVTFL